MVFAILAAMAIALGVSLGTGNKIEKGVNDSENTVVGAESSNDPSSSMYPSTAPSFSLVPSSIPTLVPSTLSWLQQGSEIVGESARDQAGMSVTISGDGRTLAVGAPGWYVDNGDRPGYVKLYYKQFDFTGWKWKLIETFTGDAIGDLFGTSISISENGKTLAIGAPGHWENDRPGYVQVYTRGEDSGSNWTQIGEDIMGMEGALEFGHVVSLSPDGKTTAIGAYLKNGITENWSGHVRVYTVVEGGGDSSVTKSNWIQVGGDIGGGEIIDYTSSISVSLSTDGSTVAVCTLSGDDGGEENVVYVQVYNLVNDAWDQIGQNIDSENEGDELLTELGASVSLSADGKTVAVGAPYNDDNGENAGKVKVYGLSNEDTWEQIGQDLDGELAGDQAGYSVSLSRDGKTLAIGANENDGNGDNAGHVRVYRLVGSGDSLSWTQLVRTLMVRMLGCAVAFLFPYH